MLSANILEITLENKTENENSFLFTEVLSDSNTSGKEEFYKNINNTNLNIQGNFKDFIGLNYNKSLAGNKQDSIELYAGTPSMKYFGYEKISKENNYDLQNINEDNEKFTIFNIITISKEKGTSSKLENLSTLKIDTLIKSNDVDISDVNSSLLIYKDYTLEKFAISTENLYDIAKHDLSRGDEYLNPILYSKKINSNISLYGVSIISLVQHNYTQINNYFKTNDANSTNINISYKVDKQETSRIDYTGAAANEYFLTGKYQGYEYGFKWTAEYKIKNYSAFITAYYKKTKLYNVFNKKDATSNANDIRATLFYSNIDYVKKYLAIGLRYTF